MSDFEREDLDCINIQKKHGPGGELPTLGSVKAKKEAPKEAKEEPKNATWEPVKPEPNFMDKLKSCALSVWTYAIAIGFVFYWQQTGLMSLEASTPSLIVLAILAGCGVGKNMK